MIYQFEKNNVLEFDYVVYKDIRRAEVEPESKRKYDHRSYVELHNYWSDIELGKNSVKFTVMEKESLASYTQELFEKMIFFFNKECQKTKELIDVLWWRYGQHLIQPAVAV